MSHKLGSRLLNPFEDAPNPFVSMGHTEALEHAQGFFESAAGMSPELSTHNFKGLYQGLICLADDSERAALLEQTRFDPVCWEAANELAARMIKEDRTLPDPLKAFACNVLRGDAPKPKKRGRVIGEHFMRNQRIFYGVNTLLDFYPLTRSEASIDSKSACEIASEMLIRAGVSLGPDAVYKIYTRAMPINWTPKTGQAAK